MYNVGFGLGSYYLLKRSTRFQLVKPKLYSYAEIFKYGTLWAGFLAVFYSFGTLVVTGIYNPVEYV